jgi:uncharacterized protein with HEPN domain
LHLDYLRHILEETIFLLRESENITEAEFLADEKLKRAFVRSFEIIGEASKNIPDEEKKNTVILTGSKTFRRSAKIAFLHR